ncbi:MAG: hypothetical protein HS109_15645 [Burkholderiales bacterium]|nr:hypothetical protein [Burkholderiales bacterium]
MNGRLTRIAWAACDMMVLAAWVALILIAGFATAQPDVVAPDRIDGRSATLRSSSPQPEAFERSTLVEALVAASPEAARRNPPASDPVTLGFVRMLEHPPTRTSPPVPAGSDIDPLVAAIVVPIRKGSRPLSPRGRSESPRAVEGP